MQGRRAVSKDDIKSLMIGLFNPEKVPTFRKDSGIIKAVQQINRELETNYNVTDFVDLKNWVQFKKNTAQYLLVYLKQKDKSF